MGKIYNPDCLLPEGMRREEKCLGCSRCGWNYGEAARRRALLRQNGLTRHGDVRRLDVGRKIGGEG